MPTLKMAKTSLKSSKKPMDQEVTSTFIQDMESCLSMESQTIPKPEKLPYTPSGNSEIFLLKHSTTMKDLKSSIPEVGPKGPNNTRDNTMMPKGVTTSTVVPMILFPSPKKTSICTLKINLK